MFLKVTEGCHVCLHLLTGGLCLCRCSAFTTITHLKKYIALKIFSDIQKFKDVSWRSCMTFRPPARFSKLSGLFGSHCRRCHRRHHPIPSQKCLDRMTLMPWRSNSSMHGRAALTLAQRSCLFLWTACTSQFTNKNNHRNPFKWIKKGSFLSFACRTFRLSFFAMKKFWAKITRWSLCV